MLSTHVNKQLLSEKQPVPCSGLPVRTNLRAGLAWDDLDDQAAALWGKVTDAVTNATSTLTAGADASQQ